MKPVAVFQHVRLSGGSNPEIDPDVAMPIMVEQVQMAKESGLVEAAKEFHVISNGGTSNLLYASALAPAGAILHDNGRDAESLLPTVNYLRRWLQDHRDWHVLFIHLKGASHPNDALTTAWRHCMSRVVITNWRQCISDLDAGYESVGAHWLTPQRYGAQVKTPFWGGQYFWAKAEFLLTLPAVPEAPTCRADWFKSEGWIGDGPRPPRVRDYGNHWPSLASCSG